MGVKEILSDPDWYPRDLTAFIIPSIVLSIIPALIIAYVFVKYDEKESLKNK